MSELLWFFVGFFTGSVFLCGVAIYWSYVTRRPVRITFEWIQKQNRTDT